MPPLREFIHAAPTSLITGVPTQWLEDCIAAGNSDILVLVDSEDVPLRVMPLHYLLGISEPTANRILAPDIAGEGATYPADAVAHRALAEYSPMTMAVLNMTLPITTIVTQVASAPETCWVVVNQQQQYLGVLATRKFLATAIAQATTLSTSASLSADAIALPIDSMDSETTIQQQQISQSNTALLTYLGHELKTPLTSLLGLASLLRTQRLGDLNPRQVRYVSLIQQHCRRLSTWVNTFIDLGRIDSGSLKLIPHILDLAHVWRESYRQASLRLGRETSEPPDLPPLLEASAPTVTLVADPPRLQQMLTCLIQTALVTQVTESEEQTEFPLQLEIFDDWVAFIATGLDEVLNSSQLADTSFALPFPSMLGGSSTLASEIGHWLEWLLVRKLAQLHGGELVWMAHSRHGTCPTLLLPTTPAPIPVQNSRFLLLLASNQVEQTSAISQQASQLNYRLLLTHKVKDAIEITAHLPLAIILVFVEGLQSVDHLHALKTQLNETEHLLVALVPPQWSALLGELPADRELLWPANTLGSVLLQPPTITPPPNRITVLYLKATDLDAPQLNGPALQLPHIFHEFGCRVLEVDDLEQAGLLRRVWRPDVAILDPDIANPEAYLQIFSSLPELVSLPLITLTMASTQAAHKLKNLQVFPCLVGETPWDTPDASDRMAAWLIQVLRVAATHNR